MASSKRARLPASAFAYVDSRGRRRLPIHDESHVRNALARFSAHITRVEVHLGDENAGKHGRDDKRCMMEVRLERRQPVAVTHHAETVVQAIDGAADKMAHLLEHALGRLHNHRAHTPAELPVEPAQPVPPEG